MAGEGAVHRRRHAHRRSTSALYLALLAAPRWWRWCCRAREDSSLTEAVGANEGLIASAAIIPIIALLVILGLRDKTIFLAARSEQWLPALVFFAFFPFVDMIVAAKLLIVLVWFGAGISKLNRHFENVIPPMVSNTPWLPIKGIKRMHYANFPERPASVEGRQAPVPRRRRGRRADPAVDPAVLARPDA